LKIKVAPYRNGDPTPNVPVATQSGSVTTGAYCNYNNDENKLKMLHILVIYQGKKNSHTKFVMDFVFYYLILLIILFVVEFVVIWINKIRWQHHSDNDGYYHSNHLLNLENHVYIGLGIGLVLMLFYKTINEVVINWNERKVILNYTKLLMPHKTVTIDFKNFNYVDEIVANKELDKKEYKLKLYNKNNLVFTFDNSLVNMELAQFEKEVITPLKLIVEYRSK